MRAHTYDYPVHTTTTWGARKGVTGDATEAPSVSPSSEQECQPRTHTLSAPDILVPRRRLRIFSCPTQGELAIFTKNMNTVFK